MHLKALTLQLQLCSMGAANCALVFVLVFVPYMTIKYHIHHSLSLSVYLSRAFSLILWHALWMNHRCRGESDLLSAVDI